MQIRLELEYELTEVTKELLDKVKRELGKQILDLNTPCGISPLYSKKDEKNNTLRFHVVVDMHKEYEFKQNKTNKEFMFKDKKGLITKGLTINGIKIGENKNEEYVLTNKGE